MKPGYLRSLTGCLIVSASFLLNPQVSPQARADESEGFLNRLLAPGPLIEGHKNLEGSDCLKCHETGKGISEAKCLECHKEIKPFVDGKKGFHGLTTQTCIQCHSDHKGRTFDSTVVDQKSFKHDLTGYKLEGKHAEITCKKCHVERRIKKTIRTQDLHYLGAQTSCKQCHKKDDIHHFTGKWAKMDCVKCHGLKTWKSNITFDHDKDTRYKLIGKHAEIKCVDCHKNGRYQWPKLIKSQCLSCHADFHKNNLSAKFQGGRCDTCHGQETWKISNFNHKVTRYPLRGKHAEIQCVACHKQKPAIKVNELKHYRWAGLKTDCLSCHKDFHAFAGFKSKRLGNLNQCLSCHSESKWEEIHDFNHSVDTRFAIEGKHIGLDCNGCHIPGWKKLKSKSRPIVSKYHWDDLKTKNCEACHVNPHLKSTSAIFKQKRCDQCHVAEGWLIFNRNGKKFDHDKTRFKLTGRHNEISCSACHVVGKKEVFKFTHVELQFCVDCHKNQHGDQFHSSFSAKSCAECHLTTKFTELKPFDHNQTSFALRGKHAELKCQDCHTPTQEFFSTKPPHVKSLFLFPDLPKKDCTLCHADYHNGQLGAKCSTCHNETTWKQVKFDHNTQSRFLIQGKHVGIKCQDCHKPVPGLFVNFNKQRKSVILYKPISPECTTCHKDPHNGHFGARCQECHMDKGWKLTKDFHKNFTLSGVHFSLQCQECHRDNRRLAGASQQCILCHQKDDIHQGTLPDCGKCHKQQFWEDVDFKHSLTRFPLRGAHRSLECAECHRNGIYQGLNNQCISCHLDIAKRSTVHPNPIPNFVNCAQCHNQFGF